MSILKKNCCTEEFDLRDAGIGKLAGKAIAKALKSDKYYTSLILAGKL
jgi:hypothetical protein